MIKLNVYSNDNKREIVNTFEADKMFVRFGAVEEICNIITPDMDETALSFAVLRNIGMVKEIIKDIFVGITDEDIENTDAGEIGSVLYDVLMYVIVSFMGGLDDSEDDNEKN